MKAKSIKGNLPEEIQLALEQSMADGFKPTLAVAFISIKQNRKAICKLLDENGIAIFGATTNGEFIDENLSKESAAILLLDMNPDHFRILFEEFQVPYLVPTVSFKHDSMNGLSSPDKHHPAGSNAEQTTPTDKTQRLRPCPTRDRAPPTRLT